MQINHIRPKKSLGQNFLKDENIARKIVAALTLSKDDYVLEVGAGGGVLTRHLIQSGAFIVAVEIDQGLVKILAQQFKDQANFTLLHQDILKLSFEKIMPGRRDWKVVGNLPYHITTPLLFKIFRHKDLFQQATFMVQKEVALRIVAQPGSKDYGILSIFSQLHADVTKLFDVSRFVFFPVPQVTSSVIQWRFKHYIDLNNEELTVFHELVKKVFSQRRKMLRNSLKIVNGVPVDLSVLKVDLEKRPDQLDVSEFVQLSKQIAAVKPQNR